MNSCSLSLTTPQNNWGTLLDLTVYQNAKWMDLFYWHSLKPELGHIIISHSVQLVYPMLRADCRFWLVNNREIWSRISRLTSSAWDIKTKERHWWRHNGDSDRRPLSLPLRYDLVTLCLYGDLSQINVIAGLLKLRKRFRMLQILLEHGINSLPRVCFRGYGNLSTRSIAIPRAAEVLRCCVWINCRIRVSKQGVTNSISLPKTSSKLAHHDDVIKWKHFPRYWPFVRGQCRGALMFSFICDWINGWVNDGGVGDKRRHRAHYDVIVMWIWNPIS